MSYLTRFPLFTLLLETEKNDGQNMGWSLEHLLDDLLPALSVVDLFDHPLVDGLALSAKARRKLERGALGFRHNEELLHNRLDKLNRPRARLNVVVIVMSVLFNAMQGIFKLVLTVGNESRVFRRPRGVRSPFIIEHTVAQLITAAARLLALTLW